MPFWEFHDLIIFLAVLGSLSDSSNLFRIWFLSSFAVHSDKSQKTEIKTRLNSFQVWWIGFFDSDIQNFPHWNLKPKKYERLGRVSSNQMSIRRCDEFSLKEWVTLSYIDTKKQTSTETPANNRRALQDLDLGMVFGRITVNKKNQGQRNQKRAIFWRNGGAKSHLPIEPEYANTANSGCARIIYRELPSWNAEPGIA